MADPSGAVVDRAGRRRGGRAAARAALAVALAALAVGAAAGPAKAHDIGRAEATSYQTRILRVEPLVRGLSVRPVDAGQRLELTNTTGREVMVLGYAGEPFLRVGPGGVFENQRSPASWLGRASSTSAPAQPGPGAVPAWRRVGTGPTVAWHDQRAHWNGLQDPPQVRAAPRRAHVVVPGWRIELLNGDQRVAVVGDVRWVPAPGPWPLGTAAALAVVVLAASRHRRWPPLLAGLTALLVAADVGYTTGSWAATGVSPAALPAGGVVSLAAWLAGLVAIWRLLGRDPARAILSLLLAALLVTVVSGLGNLSALRHSQLIVALPDPVARGLLAITIGLGIGLAVAALLQVRMLPDR